MNPSIAVKAAWDPEAKVFYTAYSDLLGLKVEAKTIDEPGRSCREPSKTLRGDWFLLT